MLFRRALTASVAIFALLGVAARSHSDSITVERGSLLPSDPWFIHQWPLSLDRDCDLGLGILRAWQSLGWPQRRPAEQSRPKIAVIDTGVNSGTSDCRGRLGGKGLARARHELAAGIAQGVGVGPRGEADAGADCHGHGTAIASIIAATSDNGEGIAGMAWPLAVYSCQAARGAVADPVRVEDCLAWVRDVVDRGHDVRAVNLSLQDTAPHPGTETRIRELQQRGVLVVAAAGNDLGTDNDSTSRRSYPASYPISNVISVAAVDQTGELYMSRRGARTVHVAAPGRDIPAVDPTTAEMRLMHGTSPAAAYVTGLIALLVAQEPSRDWRALRNLVLAGGVPLPSLQDSTITGRRVCAMGPSGLGALGCRGQRVVRRLSPVENEIDVTAEEALEIRYLSIDCALPRATGPLRVTDRATNTVVEVETEDEHRVGEWRAIWTPLLEGDFDVTIADGGAGEALRVHVVKPTPDLPRGDR